jgi:uncharacterized membrane protein YhaH (DUF805 family)
MPFPQVLLWLFFGFSGRVSRAAYFLAGLLLAIIQAFFLYRAVMAQDAGLDASAWESAFVVTFFASLWSNVALGVKRLHDFDRPGIIAVALFIPVVSIIAFVALCLFPGTPGPNQYGSRTNAPK